MFGYLHEHGHARDRQLEIALIVERHRRELAERVLTVEIHPSAPDSSAYATFRRLASIGACGLRAGPVP
jgi:hypothetical protein